MLVKRQFPVQSRRERGFAGSVILLVRPAADVHAAVARSEPLVGRLGNFGGREKKTRRLASGRPGQFRQVKIASKNQPIRSAGVHIRYRQVIGGHANAAITKGFKDHLSDVCVQHALSGVVIQHQLGIGEDTRDGHCHPRCCRVSIGVQPAGFFEELVAQHHVTLICRQSRCGKGMVRRQVGLRND